jgi:hypothetical protein
MPRIIWVKGTRRRYHILDEENGMSLCGHLINNIAPVESPKESTKCQRCLSMRSKYGYK